MDLCGYVICELPRRHLIEENIVFQRHGVVRVGQGLERSLIHIRQVDWPCLGLHAEEPPAIGHKAVTKITGFHEDRRIAEIRPAQGERPPTELLGSGRDDRGTAVVRPSIAQGGHEILGQAPESFSGRRGKGLFMSVDLAGLKGRAVRIKHPAREILRVARHLKLELQGPDQPALHHVIAAAAAADEFLKRDWHDVAEIQPGDEPVNPVADAAK